jgi:hypothetical protein
MPTAKLDACCATEQLASPLGLDPLSGFAYSGFELCGIAMAGVRNLVQTRAEDGTMSLSAHRITAQHIYNTHEWNRALTEASTWRLTSSIMPPRIALGYPCVDQPRKMVVSLCVGGVYASELAWLDAGRNAVWMDGARWGPAHALWRIAHVATQQPHESTSHNRAA